jgi:glycosyltransferase involved in cell wall biosynthesis
MQLTIAILTMNRKNQLKEAIESVFSCTLPEKTEIVVLDNASTDDTESVMNKIAKNSSVPIRYYYSPVNTGVGGGRAKLFDYANAKM